MLHADDKPEKREKMNNPIFERALLNTGHSTMSKKNGAGSGNKKTLKYRIWLILFLPLLSLATSCSSPEEFDNYLKNQGKSQYLFTYSIVTHTNISNAQDEQRVKREIQNTAQKADGSLFGIWKPQVAETEVGVGGIDLKHQLAKDNWVVILAWPREKKKDLISMAGTVLLVQNEIKSIKTTRLLEPTVRPLGKQLTTGKGFITIRWNKYKTEDVNKVIEYSSKAWVSFEEKYNTKIPGLWKDITEPDKKDGVSSLMRIAWYDEHAEWQRSRKFWKDPASLFYFYRRSRIELEDKSYTVDFM